MPRLNPQEDFEPSQITKRLWTFYRKVSTIQGGVTLPGLFTEGDLRMDLALFLFVIFLEVWGLINLWNVSQYNPIFVVFLFLLDLVFAVARHLPVGIICVLRNKLVYEDDEATKALLNKQISRRLLISNFFAILIVLLAVFKMLSFYALVGEFTPLVALIIVSYAIGASIHIFVTGYFLFGLLTEFFCWLDYNAFLRDVGGGRARYQIRGYRPHGFQSQVEISVGQVNRHTLRQAGQVSNNPNLRQYELLTWGILMDHQLLAFIGKQQTPDAKAKAVREGVRHQVEDILPAPVAHPIDEPKVNTHH